MDFRDTLSGELPAPRDDEPDGVRRDIVDELADHLACSYNRELLRGLDPDAARQRVFQRFGDPAAVARRLWLEAIGAKLMAQRVLVATCLVVSLASLFLAGAIWVQSNRDRVRAQEESARAAVEALKAMTAQNARAEAGQQEMVKQLRAMADEIRSVRSLDWNPVTFQLTEETPEGPPAVGFSVTLSETVAAGQAPSTRHLSDRSGIADFGLVRPGHYSFKISKNSDQGPIATEGQLIVAPGSRNVKKVVCPRIPLDRAAVRIRTTWPADLEKEGLVLYANFFLNGLYYDENMWWQGNFQTVVNRSLLYGPGSSLTEVLGGRSPVPWAPQSVEHVWVDVFPGDQREIKAPEQTLKWEPGTYALTSLFVLRPRATADGGRRGHFELVAVSSVADAHISYAVRDAPPTEQEPDSDRQDVEVPDDLWVPLPRQYGLNGTIGFNARPGQVSEWTLPLWDELLTAVRASLKAK
jgi:hypothetical protein